MFQQIGVSRSGWRRAQIVELVRTPAVGRCVLVDGGAKMFLHVWRCWHHQMLVDNLSKYVCLTGSTITSSMGRRVLWEPPPPPPPLVHTNYGQLVWMHDQVSPKLVYQCLTWKRELVGWLIQSRSDHQKFPSHWEFPQRCRSNVMSRRTSSWRGMRCTVWSRRRLKLSMQVGGHTWLASQD